MPAPLKTASFKIPADLDAALTELARQRGSSRSAIVRDALTSLTKWRRRSVTALASDLVGSVDGPRDLASNPKHLAGYGN